VLSFSDGHQEVLPIVSANHDQLVVRKT